MAHVAAVDEEKLEGVALACRGGEADEAADFDGGGLRLDGYEAVLDGASEELTDALFQRGLGELMDEAAVLGEGELDVGVHEDEALELVVDM